MPGFDGCCEPPFAAGFGEYIPPCGNGLFIGDGVAIVRAFPMSALGMDC